MYIKRKATLDRIVQILQELLESFTLGGTPGYPRHFSPISPLLGVVNNDFDFHARSLAVKAEWAPVRPSHTDLSISPQKVTAASSNKAPAASRREFVLLANPLNHPASLHTQNTPFFSSPRPLNLRISKPTLRFTT